MHYTYMVECSDDSLYTGYTTDLARRTKEHNAGRGAKYTRSRLPVRLVYYEEHESKVTAMQREYQIKKLTREKKLKLVEKFQRESQIYEKEYKIDSIIRCRKKTTVCVP